MARNCEKHFVGLNRIFLEEQWKKDKERKRPYLQSLNTGAEIKKWIPSIKRELNYCLQQLSGARGHDYTDAKIKEFEERVQYLEREHKRFIQKLRQLDPSSSGVPWEARPYKRKNTQVSLFGHGYLSREIYFSFNSQTSIGLFIKDFHPFSLLAPCHHVVCFHISYNMFNRSSIH
ncbi:uncharacterized protein LOC135694742 isoform X2 [Rhopilema esculentum]|uniref:uncharacterized protein LOC135694742 isoform X2 n=1 Tax=Rhopilema esculentum TaxID=499914 RepID=UPI0031D99116